ncbi:hypothetical protein BMJ34_14855 [Sinorhizobium medicae]|uniref:site-specific integrase n=1 Tax=Sinorhizobium medicae TaxID=110321 RepID=UPI000C79BCA3|nr:integrase family protein [Sinorhizobium medicae]PLT99005.1 hypothetical protein BMJ34_14855 [Sinorhizobium medicae]PLU20690.1 hypothetical protein BMJ30_07860 [Sinorhizobium medicae]PLU30992.1 hypothetical protein BMJ27_23305 [Sinorhizobium medicae]
MADFISEDFVKNRIPKLMRGKDALKVRDSKLTGFMLRCRRTADDSITREFLVDYLPPVKVKDGEKPKRKWLSIGKWPTFTAEEAREQARQMLQAVKNGDDPAATRAAKKAQPTIEQLWQLFDEKHLSLKSGETPKDYRGRYRRIIEPSFRGRRVADITRAEVDALRVKFKHKKTDCNRALAVLSKMMSFAMLQGWRTDNPCSKVPRFTETPNDIWLDEQALPPFIVALGKVEGPMGDLLRFIAVSGWRISAARLLRWDQVNLQRLEVHLDDKATKIHATALSTDAAMLIDSQPHRMGYVFSNRKGKYPIDYGDVLSALSDVCKEAGVERITPHRLRSTCATHAAVNGANVSELMQTFGWKTPAMALRYVKRSESLARKGVERAAGIINIFNKPAADVKELSQNG